MQTKRQSMYEVITNTSVGILGSWLITLTTLQFINDKFLIATVTTLLCTVWSLSRGYAIRRIFNSKLRN